MLGYFCQCKFHGVLCHLMCLWNYYKSQHLLIVATDLLLYKVLFGVGQILYKGMYAS